MEAVSTIPAAAAAAQPSPESTRQQHLGQQFVSLASEAGRLGFEVELKKARLSQIWTEMDRLNQEALEIAQKATASQQPATAASVEGAAHV